MESINEPRASVQDDETLSPLYSIESTGEILKDKKTDFRTAKLKSLAVARVLPAKTKAELRRSSRMFDCGQFLTFAVSEAKDMRLYRANFCRDRMCPACQQRRSRIIFHQVKNVCNSILAQNPTYSFLLLTLTVPNVRIDELSSKISEMGKAWGKLVKRVRFKRSIKGWFRTLEITYNSKTQTYHPHYHILLCVPSGYFKKSYIKQAEWLELWRDVMKDEFITQVDIRKVKPNSKRADSTAISSACAEVGKYATKPSDYLKKVDSPDKYIANAEIVTDLVKIIKGRKLIAYGGIMLEHSVLLEQEDVESDDIDLIKVGDEDEDFRAAYVQTFHWNIGLTNYIA